MAYLYQKDYDLAIQDVSLSQVISANLAFLPMTEQIAVAEAVSYLVQKYDTAAEFTDTIIYDPNVSYKSATRVYLDAPAYSSAASYALKQLCLQNGSVYQCTTPINTPELFNPTHWLLLGVRYDMYYGLYPEPVFNIKDFYQVGKQVFWQNKIYKCLIATVILDHEDLLQYGNTQNVPYRNTIPGTPGSETYWQYLADYLIPSESLLNTTVFKKGDNRNPQMVMYCTDLLIYHLYRRIIPKGIPSEREARYNAAVLWLKMSAKGDVTAALTKKQPPQGGRIRWGSNIKQVNSY